MVRLGPFHALAAACLYATPPPQHKHTHTIAITHTHAPPKVQLVAVPLREEVSRLSDALNAAKGRAREAEVREKAAAAEHQAELIAVRSDIKARVNAMAAEAAEVARSDWSRQVEDACAEARTVADRAVTETVAAASSRVQQAEERARGAEERLEAERSQAMTASRRIHDLETTQQVLKDEVDGLRREEVCGVWGGGLSRGPPSPPHRPPSTRSPPPSPSPRPRCRAARLRTVWQPWTSPWAVTR